MLKLYVTELADARDELLRVYYRCQHPDAHPKEGGWSARQIMHHLYLSENGIARIYKALDRAATPCDSFSDEALERERDALRNWVGNRDEKVEAPERITPLNLEAELDVVRELAVSRDLLIDNVSTLSDAQLRSYCFPHPLRGKLSLYGWLWFVAWHERRHTEQLRHHIGA